MQHQSKRTQWSEKWLVCVFFMFAHTRTHRLLKCVQIMNESVRWMFFLPHEEQSPEADNRSAAKPTFYRDTISVCPQRAAGITVVNFTVLSVNHRVKRCFKTHPFGSTRQASHFQDLWRGTIHHYSNYKALWFTVNCCECIPLNETTQLLMSMIAGVEGEQMR